MLYSMRDLEVTLLDYLTLKHFVASILNALPSDSALLIFWSVVSCYEAYYVLS
ncbi:hypothetical protein BDQ12DRAFT_690847 [Crucibulum laeve]|uniref:Uncharacterized protein n=1 Tax=Crucibulum laeve TaxID=68775 RepID=A0A5C3LLA0_9AGAR|nr:hypothetical protein BDQ12DRAFT_690847 [Crucibulum laeve]